MRPCSICSVDNGSHADGRPCGRLRHHHRVGLRGYAGQQHRDVQRRGGSPTGWSDTSITVPVPSGATTGYVLVTVGGLSSYGVIFAVATSNLTVTGSLNTARMFQTMTVLDNGSVLIAGGVDGFGYNTISSAELYNPTNATFAFTGSLNNGRIFDTATLLNNGKVLMAGGTDSNWNNIAPAELYDPVAGAFSFTGSMSTPRDSHTATVLNNGRVLLVGGVSSNGLWITALAANAEIYDPVAGTFSSTGSLSTARDCHTATLLSNGKVLIVGGNDVNGYALASAELYDPTAGTFTLTGSLNFGRAVHAASLLNNGMVLIAGGYDTYGNAVANAELYNPATATVTGSMNVPRYDMGQSTLLTNGMVLIAGGQDTNGNTLNSVELYDPTAGTFSVTGGMNSTRQSLTTTLLNNGQVLIAAGMDYYANVLTSAELYQPSTLTPAGLVSIALSPQNPSLTVGGTQQFVATGTFSGNTTEALASVAWSSSATSVATVSNDASNYGNALAVALGTATISACAGSVCGSTTLTVAPPAPSISGLSPAVGVVGTSVTIAGTTFGATQGSSTVTFNGTAATPTAWSDTSIAVPVPAGATTGNVVVTVGGVASNGILFTLASYTSGYLYRQTIVLSHTQVPNTDQTNFPALISGVYSNLATVANGGFVQSPNGYDIIFSQDAEGATKLDHEIDNYNPVTGAVGFWVRIPTLSHTVDTVIYVFYGNPNVTVSQENKPGVWQNSYAGVWHFGTSTSLSPNDSTANANNGTIYGATPAVGEIGGAGSFNGASSHLNIPDASSIDPVHITVSVWFKYSAVPNAMAVVSKAYNGPPWSYPFVSNLIGVDSASVMAFDVGNGSAYSSFAPPYATVAGAWYYALYTYDGTTLKAYMNGSLVGTNTTVSGNIAYNGAGTPPWIIGADDGASPYYQFFDGLIDEVRISSIARSADWIATEYANESSPSAFYTVEGKVTATSPPAIQLLSPSAGNAGTAITILGAGFQPTQGSSTVTFNGLMATPTSWNDASIVVPVPAAATSGNVVVTVNGVASNGMPFTVPPPNIASLSPNAGPLGTVVTITGTNFGPTQGSSTVTFNGTTATPTSWSTTTIVVPMPPEVTTGEVVVAVNGVASNGMTFTVTAGVGTTILSDSMGRNTVYGYQGIDGRNFMGSIAGSGCASCGGRGNTLLTYDALGNVLSSTDALGNTASYTYDSMGNVLTKTQYLNPNTPLTWSYTYNSFQEVLTATDPLGNVTTNVYDTNGNLLSTTTPPPSGSGSGLTTNFQYNTLGELTQVTDPKGNTTSMTYTAAGLVASITDAQGNTTTFTYDGRGNRLTSTDALNNTTTYTYDSMNRLTKITAPDQSTTQFAYDYRGRRISVTDANGKATAYQYDDADRLVAVTDAAQNSTIYGYDTENNMVGITDAASHQTAFAYDALGRVTAVTFPSTLSESYTYDAVNNLLSKTDRKNQAIQYGYDALYRLTSKTYPDSTAVNYTYDPLSRLTQVTDPSGTYSFAYDNLGRLLGTGTQYSFLSGTLTNSYAYDAASNRVSFSNPQSQITNYSYDSLNRLTSLTDPNTGQFGFGYDALGRRTSLTRPNGVSTSYSYDTLSRLLSVLHGGGSLPGSTSYTYDAAGNRLTKTAVQEASPNPVSVLSQYTYDPIYELTQAVVNSSVAESYSYDAVANRLTSAGPTSYSYNASNELTSNSTATYAYDNDGNTTSKTTSGGTTNYTWDFENRLASVTLPGAGGTVYFKYDPFGRRVYKSSSVGTSIYAYDLGNLVEEMNSGGGVVAQYTQADNLDEPLAMLRSGATSYYEADGLGSVTSLSNTAGALAQTYTFDSFGNLTSSTGSLTSPFQFTAREFDSETSLYFYRARYYDPLAGRFLSEDPLGPAQEGPNLYEYVSNNPIMNVDPLGRYKIDKSCTDHPCVSIGGGGPNNPSQAPHQANVQQLIQQTADAACSNLNGITDPKLRSCLQKRCKSGKIKCSDNCPQQQKPQAGNAPYSGNTATLCLDSVGTPSWSTPQYFGGTIIHEWAHTCGWHHGQGEGVPHDPGPDKP